MIEKEQKSIKKEKKTFKMNLIDKKELKWTWNELKWIKTSWNDF